MEPRRLASASPLLVRDPSSQSLVIKATDLTGWMDGLVSQSVRQEPDQDPHSMKLLFNVYGLCML